MCPPDDPDRAPCAEGMPKDTADPGRELRVAWPSGLLVVEPELLLELGRDKASEDEPALPSLAESCRF